MKVKKKIFAIIGSASSGSTNIKLVDYLANITDVDFEWTINNDLKFLPHFDPELSADNPPASIIAFRKNVSEADGILICTPEYVFSLPSGLKNAIEWCVATTVFSEKPCGLITASTNGQKGHKSLLLIMKTVTAKYTKATTLLISGIKGKINLEGHIIDEKTTKDLKEFAKAFKKLVHKH